ncbi:MAG: hypothetical protein ACI4F8_10240 [Lachnospiraceae bacterium]
MLNEEKEFMDYTQSPDYTGKNILGRFTVESIRDFLGFERIFSILARGYLFRGGDPYDNVETARKALCAWCSIPEKTPKGWDGEFTTCFPELCGEFPELVDENGCGWYIRHIRAISNLAEQYPKKVTAGVRALFPEKLPEHENQWRKKVRQFQIPIFQESTDAIWQLRFDDIIANALTLGPLRGMGAEVTEQQKEKLLPFIQDKVKLEHLTTLVAYYEANKLEDSDWVVLPAASFNNYFGSTVFSKQVLTAVTGTVLERSDMSYGSRRYRVLEEYLPIL